MKRLTIGLLFGLAACQALDWRAREIAAAEEKIRGELADPDAKFSAVQLTGDQTSGQTCGKVKVTKPAAGSSSSMRFIVYIDATAGPFIEGGVGSHPVSDDEFKSYWHADCVGEGYRTPA